MFKIEFSDFLGKKFVMKLLRHKGPEIEQMKFSSFMQINAWNSSDFLHEVETAKKQKIG